MKKSLLFVLLFFAQIMLFAQMEQCAFIQKHKISVADSNKLFFSVTNRNIVKNNEYFNHITPGYTMLGSQVNLRLKYYPTKNTMVTGGVHLLYYYGMNKLQRVLPLITFSYTPVKGMYLVIGNIYGDLNHRFLEPMYKFEKFMEESPETGFQFLYDNKWVHADVFINWRYFLLPDDFNHKEIFSAGISSYVNLINTNHRFQAQIPIQFLYNHKGGQIDTLNQPLITIKNSAVGLKLSYGFTGFVKKVGASLYYLSYVDASGEKQQPYDKGYGLMPELIAESKLLNIHVGYWKAHEYIAPLGEPLFSSVSYYNRYEGETFPEREMFYFKADFHHNIASGIFLGIRYEGYLDLLKNISDSGKSNYDFSYSIYLNFNHDFFLLKTKVRH